MEKDIPNLSNTAEQTKTGSKKFFPLVVLVVVLGLGIFTGYKLANKGQSAIMIGGTEIPKKDLVKGKEFGAEDASIFKDTATGVVEKGGVDGEGTHHLTREGGPSQTVYMTSSVMDLDQFIGLKVQIWGETFKGQKAGWLMDVGKLKILE